MCWPDMRENTKGGMKSETLTGNSANSVVVKCFTVEFGHFHLEFLCHILCSTLVLGKRFYS